MELTFVALILLPVGLGLLGFVEPCSVGAHLIFLSSQEENDRQQKTAALVSFISVRVLVMGAFGGIIVFAGQRLIDLQTWLWLTFGVLYLLVGLAFFLGHAGVFKRRISLAPQSLRRARSPLVQGAAFGLNIPACAAPILFGLLGVATTSGSVMTGFSMMALFGFALSAPLIPISFQPALAVRLKRLSDWLRTRYWVLGAVFVLLGLWSIYFGLFVDPADWSLQ